MSESSVEIRSLQEALRDLGQRYPWMPAVRADGIFGERTLEALMYFQRQAGLPVTGRPDGRTVKILREQRAMYCSEGIEPRALRAFPGRETRITAGEARPCLVIMQAMFHVLSRTLEGIVPCGGAGVHNEASGENVKWLQKCAGQEVTGEVDLQVWDSLCRLYEVFGRDRIPAETC